MGFWVEQDITYLVQALILFLKQKLKSPLTPCTTPCSTPCTEWMCPVLPSKADGFNIKEAVNGKLITYNCNHTF